VQSCVRAIYCMQDIELEHRAYMLATREFVAQKASLQECLEHPSLPHSMHDTVTQAWERRAAM
jgi:hypothetical protein